MADMLLAQMIKFNIIEKEEEEIYRFGLESLLLKLIHYSTYLFIAVFFREVIPFLFFFVAFLLLRKNAGGYHAKTKWACYVRSCLVVIGTVFGIKWGRTWSNAEFICAALVIIGDIVIYKIAPLGNRKRELDGEEIRYFRRRTRSFLAIENMFLIAFAMVGMREYVLAIVMAIICEGILLLLVEIKN